MRLPRDILQRIAGLPEGHTLSFTISTNGTGDWKWEVVQHGKTKAGPQDLYNLNVLLDKTVKSAENIQ